MTEPIPTPYDIFLPQGPAWVPSATVWGLVLCACMALALFTYLTTRRRRGPPVQLTALLAADLKGATNALTRCSQEPHEFQEVSKSALSVALRIAEFRAKRDLASCGIHDLRLLAERMSSHEEQKKLAELISQIALCKEASYRPLYERNAEHVSNLSGLLDRAEVVMQAVLSEAANTSNNRSGRLHRD